MALTAKELAEHPEVRGYSLGMPTDSLVYQRPFTVPDTFVEECLRTVHKWAPRHAKEATYAQEQYDVPSAFVRIDATLDAKNRLRVYEIEDRPSGLGILSIVDPEAFKHFRAILDRWQADCSWANGLTSVITPSRHNTHDDRGWGVDLAHLPELPASDQLLIIRSNPYDFMPGGDWTEVYAQLAAQSLSSLIAEGNKSYGEGWLWSRVCSPQDLLDLGFDETTPFALKPRHGSKFQDAYGREDIGVELYHPNATVKGRTNWGKITATLGRARDHAPIEPCTSGCGMYVQHYLPPIIREDALGKRQVILRVFLAWDPECKAGSTSAVSQTRWITSVSMAPPPPSSHESGPRKNRRTSRPLRADESLFRCTISQG